MPLIDAFFPSRSHWIGLTFLSSEVTMRVHPLHSSVQTNSTLKNAMFTAKHLFCISALISMFTGYSEVIFTTTYESQP